MYIMQQVRVKLLSSFGRYPIARGMSTVKRFQPNSLSKTLSSDRLSRIEPKESKIDYFYHHINRIYHGKPRTLFGMEAPKTPMFPVDQNPSQIIEQAPKTRTDHESEQDYGGAICFVIQTAMTVFLFKKTDYLSTETVTAKLFRIVFPLFGGFFCMFYPKACGFWVLCLLSMDRRYGLGAIFFDD